MNIKPSAKAAFLTLRSIAGIFLCITALLLAVSASFAVHRQHAGASARASKNVPVRSHSAKSGGAPVASTSITAPAPSYAGTATAARVGQNRLGQKVYSVSAAHFDVSPPLSQLALLPTKDEPWADAAVEHELPPWRVVRSAKRDPVVQAAPTARTTSAPSRFPAPAAAATTGFNFLGMIGSTTGGYPPDNNGSVGNDQYVETVNTRYQVWSLNRTTNTATSVAGPSSIYTLWSGFGGACSTRNDGDPVVLFDKVANRWMISQFTSGADANGWYYQCVAISQTANAAGSYYRYAFQVPSKYFQDYPHYGVWTDAYYMMAHVFTTSGSTGSYVGGAFCAMDRTKMLAGDSSATWQVITDTTEGGHMPADIDGFAPPPGGAPGIFASPHSDGMYLYRMKVDFTNPANTTKTVQAVLPIASYTAACSGGNCIPQPGSTATVDSLADRLMFRLAYRNYVDHESLVVSHSVDPSVTGVVSGVRWYEFRLSGQPNAVCSTYPCIYQQGTVADTANGRSRWMPSIAMDSAENILLGYSTTGKTAGSDNHSIRYTGRGNTDALGTMTVPETIVATGTANISNTSTTPGRWGDYTSMSVDPADDCTFWYVNEVYTSKTNALWRTQVASARFPAGTGAGQCQAGTCTTRPSSAPVIGTATANANNQITISWTPISPAAGSYAIERAAGAAGSEGLYQPVGSVLGSVSSFTDTTVQGGLTYSYRVVAATDTAGKCQALVRSNAASATASGQCSLKPVFGGATSASSTNGSACGIQINWTPATSSCPLSTTMRYNIFRGTTPDFTPAVANRIASCVPGPSSYVDTADLVSGTSYYYVVRAEDNTTGNGGECGGGNEDSNTVVVSGTSYGSGLQATPSTWTDGGGDGTAFLTLNAGTTDQTWRFVKTANDSGANHTSAGSYAYRTAGPTAASTYASNLCSAAETPTLTVGATSVNLTYWERHQLEKGWDGIAIEYSRNGGAWTDLPAPTNSTANGCLSTDVTTDYTTLGCTQGNGCSYSTTKSVITGPVGSGTSCTNWTTGALTSYARRCHFLTGLTAGDTIKFRWKMVSDSSAEYAGFYLDDVAVTNILLPNACDTNGIPKATTTVSVNPASGTYGGTTTLSATLISGGAGVSGKTVTFAVNGTSKGSAITDGSGVATLANVSLTGINAGSYPTGVSASFAGDSSYASGSGTEALTVAKASQSITVTTGAPASAAYNAQFTVAATSSSSLAVSYTSSGVCTNSGATYTMTSGTGSCSVKYDQAGNTNYNAASQVVQSVNATPANQTITFAALGNKTYGNADFTVSATASSGLTVAFAGSGNCTVSGTNVHLTGAGSCTVTASQDGSANYNAATPVARTFTIAKAASSTAMTSAQNPSTQGDSITLTATVTSGAGTPTGSVTFSDGGTALGSGTLDGSGVATYATSALGVGTHQITAGYAGDTNYNTSTSSTVSQIVLPPATPTPTATPTPAPGLTLDGAVSRHVHGSSGSFDVNLVSGPKVESRSGASGHTLVFTFSNNVSSGSVAVKTGTATAGAASFSGNTMTVDLSNVPDAQRLTFTLQNVTDQYSQVLADTDVTMDVLMGDVNGDDVVDSTDVLVARSHTNDEAIDQNNFMIDVNADEAIDSTDILLIRSNSDAAVQ